MLIFFIEKTQINLDPKNPARMTGQSYFLYDVTIPFLIKIWPAGDEIPIHYAESECSNK